MDRTRFCLWACSDNVSTALQSLTETQRPYASHLRCGVIYYPVFRNNWSADDSAQNPLAKELREDVPLFYVEVGKEALEYKRSADSFARKIRSARIPLEHVYYEEGVHGFDIFMDSGRTREIIDRTIAFMKRHLS